MAQKLKLSDRELKKKIQTQNMIIIALAIIIVVLVIVSSTAAWYIRTKTDSADIILSNPVNIYITEFSELKDATGQVITDGQGNPIMNHELRTDILENYNTKVYPGDKIKMRLGMQVGSAELASSPAFVRVKLVVTYENIYTGETSGLDDVAGQKLIRYKDKPDESIWHRINFNKFAQDGNSNIPDDYWFVLKSTEGASIVSRKAYTGDQFEFLDGYIELDKEEITNAQANCKFHINYIVEAVQTANVPDPIRYQGYGPWWNDILGKLEDIPGYSS